MNAPDKQGVLLALLQRCQTAFVHLDPRKGAAVPEWLRRQAQVVFQLGYNMPQPMRDFHVTDHGFTVGLMFKGSLHYIDAPWGSVFAMVGDDAKGCVWGSDVPSEIAAKLQHEALKQAPAIKKAKPQPAGVIDARERFEEARIDGAIARNFDGVPNKAPAPVISLVGRKPSAKA